MTTRPWSAGRRTGAGLLVAVEVVLVVAALAALGFAVLMIVADQSSSDDDGWKGFGTFLAINLIVLALPLLVAAAGLAGATREAVRTEDGAGLRRRARTMLILAGGWSVLVLAVGPSAVGGLVVTSTLVPAVIIGAAALASFSVAGPVSD